MKNIKKSVIAFNAVCIYMIVLSGCAQNNKQDILDEMDTVCDTTATTFAAEIKPIFDQHCSTPSCHSAVTSAGGYDFSNYSKIKDAVLGPRLFGTINHEVGFSPMPKNQGKLAECDINKITIWARKGARNN